ncbi:MAG: HNH endonuclease, partial [Marinosulfonomonas sp.]|nr:HNH endonuclease [Marinosulfonomonas sp.]
SIVNHGMQELTGPETLPRQADQNQPDTIYGFAETQAPFGPAPMSSFRPDILTSRKYRDPSFQRQVKAAYGGRCAISGLELRNGGGRPEVEAAHIRSVKDGGPDIIRNGLALSGTLHWMFDRGLISVADDQRILISHNKVPKETVARLIARDQKLILPRNPRHHPHPDYLRYHRENVFGQMG